MKKLSIVLVVLTAFHLTPAFGDEYLESQINRAAQSIASYPLVEDQADEATLVRMWSQIDAIGIMVGLKLNNKEAFLRQGKGAIRPHQMHKRIDSHLRHLKSGYDDPDADVLAGIIRLHAYMARDRLDGRIEGGAYSEMLRFATGEGRIVASRVAEKFNTVNSLLPEEKSPFRD